MGFSLVPDGKFQSIPERYFRLKRAKSKYPNHRYLRVEGIYAPLPKARQRWLLGKPTAVATRPVMERDMLCLCPASRFRGSSDPVNRIRRDVVINPDLGSQISENLLGSDSRGPDPVEGVIKGDIGGRSLVPYTGATAMATAVSSEAGFPTETTPTARSIGLFTAGFAAGVIDPLRVRFSLDFESNS